MLDGGKPVCNHNGGSVLHQFNNGILYQAFRLSIKGRGGFVQDQYGRICQNCTGNTDSLHLSPAQFSSTFTNTCFICILILHDEVMGISHLCSIYNPLQISSFAVTKRYVIPEGVVEKDGLLTHHAH